MRYEGDPGYTGSDHNAQVIRIISKAPATHLQAAPEGWSWQRMDGDIIKDGATRIKITENLDSPEALDRAVDGLIEQLRELADASTPRRRLGTGRSVPWWDEQVGAAVRERAGHAGGTQPRSRTSGGNPSGKRKAPNNALCVQHAQSTGHGRLRKPRKTTSGSGPSLGRPGYGATAPRTPQTPGSQPHGRGRMNSSYACRENTSSGRTFLSKAGGRPIRHRGPDIQQPIRDEPEGQRRGDTGDPTKHWSLEGPRHTRLAADRIAESVRPATSSCLGRDNQCKFLPRVLPKKVPSGG